jgi:hypothetical protein
MFIASCIKLAHLGGGRRSLFPQCVFIFGWGTLPSLVVSPWTIAVIILNHKKWGWKNRSELKDSWDHKIIISSISMCTYWWHKHLPRCKVCPHTPCVCHSSVVQPVLECFQAHHSPVFLEDGRSNNVLNTDNIMTHWRI